MSSERLVNDYMASLRTAFANQIQKCFEPSEWLLIADHVYDYPCRKVSERLIWRLMFNSSHLFRVSTQGIKLNNRVFVFTKDSETGLDWRFTLEIEPKFGNVFPKVVTIVSAYPKGGKDKGTCCYYNIGFPRCIDFRVPQSRP
jgi:hypothetical protein